MSDWPDQNLLKRFHAKDPEAITQVVRAHAGDLLRAARGLGRGESDAEELVQSVFVAFLGAVERFEGRSSVRTFLFGILYRKALEQGRGKARELATDPSDQVFEARFGPWQHWSRPPRGPDEEAALNETARLIGDCLDALPAPQRAAFHLKEVEGETSESVCNILDVQSTHLRVLLFRARTKLRECLESKWK